MSIVRAIGFFIVFFSTFLLLFILDSLQQIVNKCEKREIRKDLCIELKRFGLPSLIFILLIASTILVILSTSYQILMKALGR